MQHTLYETLRDFQPVLTAIVALAAAATAYIGATAKVRLDKQIAAQELVRRKLAVSLRLRYEILIITDNAHSKRPKEDEKKSCLHAPCPKLGSNRREVRLLAGDDKRHELGIRRPIISLELSAGPSQ